MTDYCSAISRACEVAGSQARLAARLGVSASAVFQVKAGARPCPPRWAPLIEQITLGRVRAEELCPEVPWEIIRHSPRRRLA